MTAEEEPLPVRQANYSHSSTPSLSNHESLLYAPFLSEEVAGLVSCLKSFSLNLYIPPPLYSKLGSVGEQRLPAP